jgi:hypothetical protein
MSREVRRIALDFKAPVGKVWDGYLNPYRDRAQKCLCVAEGRHGLSPRAHELYERWWGYSRFNPEMNGSTPICHKHPYIAMLAKRNLLHSAEHFLLSRDEVQAFFAAGVDPETATCDVSAEYVFEALRLTRHYNSMWEYHLNDSDIDILVKRPEALGNTHHQDADGNWIENDPPVRPTVEELQLSMLSSFSNTRIEYHLINGICEREGVRYLCDICEGAIEIWPSQADRKLHDEWERPKPPSGTGYQLWSTVTDGTPNSPVFETPEELADFLVGPDSPERRGINSDLSRGEWLTFIIGEMQSVGSASTSASGFVGGVKAAILTAT